MDLNLLIILLHKQLKNNRMLSEVDNIMLSEVGKAYSKTKVVSPFKTRERWAYYQLEPIKSSKRLPKKMTSLDCNLRHKQDSFMLRYAKQIVTNTNHSPDHTKVKNTSPRTIVPKAAFERIIGDIRDEDFSLPLPKGCDHRCARANQVESQEPKNSRISDFSTLQTQHRKQSDIQSQICSQKEALPNKISFKRSLQLSELKSTEPSLVRKRSRHFNIDLSKFMTIEPSSVQVGKSKPPRGVKFESSSGHRYLEEVQKRQKIPEVYDIESCNESLLKKSMKKHKVHLEFGSFRDQIKTRYDRSDPLWLMRMDESQQEISRKDNSYNFGHYSNRKPNQVRNKYPFRQNLSLIHKRTIQ